MTERKPSGMDWQPWIEFQVNTARKYGAFENLPGHGKPIPDLDKPYDENWWAKSLMKREGLGYLPPSLRIRRDVEIGLEEAMELWNEEDVRTKVQTLNQEIRKSYLDSLKGPASRTPLLKEEEVVAQWQTQQEAKRAARAAYRSSHPDNSPHHPAWVVGAVLWTLAMLGFMVWFFR